MKKQNGKTNGKAKAKDAEHIAELRFDKNNARKHTPRNIGMIETSLREVGASRSIVIDEENNILAGNGTIEAAAAAGIEKVRVVDVDGETIVAVRRTGLTAKQKALLALYDNRTAELAEWDREQLLAQPDDVLDRLFFETEKRELGLTDTAVAPGELVDYDALRSLYNVTIKCESAEEREKIMKRFNLPRASVPASEIL